MANADFECGELGDVYFLATIDFNEGGMTFPEGEGAAGEFEGADEGEVPSGLVGHEGADPGPFLAIFVFLVAQFAQRVGVSAFAPGVGAATGGEVALVARSLD